MRLSICVNIVLLVLVASTSVAHAQAVTGAITGRVLDDAGLEVPGVTVTVTSPAMIGERSTVSEEGGVYRFTLLSPGTYRVSFALMGFSDALRRRCQRLVLVLTRHRRSPFTWACAVLAFGFALMLGRCATRSGSSCSG